MSPRLLGNLAGVTGMLVWTTSLPATAEVLKTWHPLLVVPARMFCGTLFLFAMLALRERQPDYTRPSIWGITIAGAYLAISTILLVVGQSLASPVSVGIIIAAMPAVSAVIGLFTGAEHPNAQIVTGILLACIGGAVTTLGAGNDLGAQGAAIGLGEILVLLSTVFFILFTRTSIIRLPDMSDLARAATTIAVATVMTAIVAAVIAATGILQLPYELGGMQIGLIVWLGIGTMGISLAFWVTACRLLGVTVASMHNNLVPFYAILFSLILGHAVSPAQLVGGLLVISGAILAQLQFKTAKFRIR
ncbi:drug/metabolite transporter (DMT)-like permease [Rhodoligotrophos appendicifer]|uniref:DMT family transporter n=1 Tax=Rhodoligotrophos appendicifer TaxID=987056 RepID=UPI00117EE5B0|nr:DMT family transporter [Rhodoligotrophos appendicifer]